METNPAERFMELAGASREEAGFFYSCPPIEVAQRTWFQCTIASVTAFETDEGLVLVDTGMQAYSPLMAQQLREILEGPVHTIIYTHHHVDHAYGATSFLAKGQHQPRVIGQRNMVAAFERYKRTSIHNFLVNLRQGRGDIEDHPPSEGQTQIVAPTFGVPDMPPDTFYSDRLDIQVGGVTFELHHARGETDDHTWVFCPERSALCTGDLIIWAVPNSGNPQKVQRYPWEWAHALREMAALEPKILCPGHGGPVVNEPELIQRILLDTASFLESIVDQTLNIMEDGSPPHIDIIQRVKVPKTDVPWLQELHGCAEFVIRDVIRYYGGWYTGRPSELMPASRQAVATEIAQLAGGPIVMADRALAIAEAGDLRLSCHLADYALEAAPENEYVRRIVTEIYQQRALAETSLMSVNLYRAAAAYAGAGRPFA